MERSFAKDMIPVIIVLVIIALTGLLVTIGVIPPDNKCQDLIATHNVYSNLTHEQKDYIFEKCKERL